MTTAGGGGIQIGAEATTTGGGPYTCPYPVPYAGPCTGPPTRACTTTDGSIQTVWAQPVWVAPSATKPSNSTARERKNDKTVRMVFLTMFMRLCAALP